MGCSLESWELLRELSPSVLLHGLPSTSACCSRSGQREARHGIRERVRAESGPDGKYHRALRPLGAYPHLPPEVQAAADSFASRLTHNDRAARIAGSEIDAAIGGPRWAAKLALESLPERTLRDDEPAPS